MNRKLISWQLLRSICRWKDISNCKHPGRKDTGGCYVQKCPIWKKMAEVQEDK